jgi:hypothetical protein
MSRSNIPTRNRFAEDEVLSNASENAKLTVIFNQNVPSSKKTRALTRNCTLAHTSFPTRNCQNFLDIWYWPLLNRSTFTWHLRRGPWPSRKTLLMLESSPSVQRADTNSCQEFETKYTHQGVFMFCPRRCSK